MLVDNKDNNTAGTKPVSAHVTVPDEALPAYAGRPAPFLPRHLRARLRGADIVFFDGTLWTDDEMLRAGVGQKTGQRMGHMSVSGADGTISALSDLEIGQKILIHINNSNPVLLADSPERAAAHAAGWDVAFDGMRITA